jgi:hypothetical protein
MMLQSYYILSPSHVVTHAGFPIYPPDLPIYPLKTTFNVFKTDKISTKTAIECLTWH